MNDTSGGRLVAKHLVSLGHERIGFINGPIALKPCAERRAGLLEILEAHGLALAPQHDLETAHMTINAGEEAAARLLDQRRLPTAIFCANDLLAIGAEHAALTRGLRVDTRAPAAIGIEAVTFGVAPCADENKKIRFGFLP